jgi:hypothetical protein
MRGEEAIGVYKDLKSKEEEADSGVLLYRVRKAFGFRSDTGRLRDKAVLPDASGVNQSCYTLADLNDRGIAFADIASYVRKNGENVWE